MNTYLILDGQRLNKLKKIHAYMKREGIDFEKTKDYMNITDEQIKEKYIIKGEVNWKTIEQAKKTNHNETEHELQVRVCQYLKKNKFAFWAVPNGFIFNGNNNLETVKYINYMKQEGYKPGVFDLTILYGNSQVAFLEIKTIKGHPSDKQLNMQKYLTEKGYKNKIAYGYDECIDFIDGLQRIGGQ